MRKTNVSGCLILVLYTCETAPIAIFDESTIKDSFWLEDWKLRVTEFAIVCLHFSNAAENSSVQGMDR